MRRAADAGPAAARRRPAAGRAAPGRSAIRATLAGRRTRRSRSRSRKRSSSSKPPSCERRLERARRAAPTRRAPLPQKLEKAGAVGLLATCPPHGSPRGADAPSSPCSTPATAPMRCASSNAAPTCSTAAERAHARRCAGAVPASRGAGARAAAARPAPEDAVRLAQRAGLAQALRPEARWRREPFKLSADPRERDLANPLLLTGSSRLRRGVGGRQRRRIRAHACPIAPRCRARWWAMPACSRRPGRRTSSATARRSSSRRFARHAKRR